MYDISLALQILRMITTNWFKYIVALANDVNAYKTDNFRQLIL